MKNKKKCPVCGKMYHKMGFSNHVKKCSKEAGYPAMVRDVQLEDADSTIANHLQGSNEEVPGTHKQVEYYERELELLRMEIKFYKNLLLEIFAR